MTTANMSLFLLLTPEKGRYKAHGTSPQCWDAVVLSWLSLLYTCTQYHLDSQGVATMCLFYTGFGGILQAVLTEGGF